MTSNNECRLCLKTLEANEKFKVIDDEIYQSFKFVTQIDLKTNGKYSKFVCEVCLRSLQLSHAIIIQFSENQRKLESRLNTVKISKIQAPSTSSTSDPLDINAHQNFSIMKEEPDDEVIKYEPQLNFRQLNENEMDYNESDYQNINWNFMTTRTETKLNKEEKTFWHNIIDRTGRINSNILYILQMNGYNSVFSFQGHFAANVDNEDLIQQLQQSVRFLDPNSDHVKNINVGRRRLETFEFTLGERCLILGLFDKIGKMIQDGSIETLGIRDEKKESLLISRTKYNLEPEHLQETIETVLRHRINNHSLNFPIVKKCIEKFPYTIWIKCMNCQKSLRVTVTEDRKANGRKNINIRTHHCIAHIKNCNSIEF
ncbi:hypothetical protein PVAND_006896 [Polypedilum vanderplanki]|uniref:ZAD domain-containing protein n=1 Tax=Polypedilum vanderplanki TaxID=319348 RepID=A0A9J6C4P4_POLVA|nr:hypothetical protein PVAND_006896 [Polypedilum vanderplanki]